MTEIISFPGLGLSFEINRVAFSIGGYNIYWYGITFALGFVVGMYYFHLRARKFGIHPYDGLDVLLWAVIGGVVGARAYFVIFQWEEMYRDNPIKIFAFREGGLAIYGGVIGAVVTGWIVCKLKKTPFLPVLDGGLTGLLLAQAVGRWGNFFNCEAFGSNTTLPWGMTSDTISRYLFRMADTLAAQGVPVDPTVPVHPTFFYEFVWNLCGFLLLAFVLTPRRKYDGQVSLGYMAWYGLGRFFIEGLRTDSLMAGSYRVSQMLALVLCAGSLLLMAVLSLRYKKNPAVLYVDTDASRERMAKVDDEMAREKAKKAGVEAASTDEDASEDGEKGDEGASSADGGEGDADASSTDGGEGDADTSAVDGEEGDADTSAAEDGEGDTAPSGDGTGESDGNAPDGDGEEEKSTKELSADNTTSPEEATEASPDSPEEPTPTPENKAADTPADH